MFRVELMSSGLPSSTGLDRRGASHPDPLLITHPRARGKRRQDLTFCLASADARGYRNATRDRHWEAAMKGDDIQSRNARLGRKIDGALKTRPELTPVVNGIALKQPANASLEQVQANLQERARAIIEAKPEL